MEPRRLQVDEITTEDEFEALQAEWSALLRRSRADTLFLSWEWLYSWWRHCGGDAELALLTVRADGELVGIAPLLRRDGLMPSLEFLGTGAVGSDYLDVIANEEIEDAVLAALARTLGDRREPLDLGQLRADQCLAADLVGRLEDGGWSQARRVVNACPFVDLSGQDWDAYLASLSSSHRYNFRRRRRHLERDFDEVSFECAEDAEQCNAFLETLVALHRKRFAEMGGSDALHRPELVAFHREFSRRALDNGWLRLFVLRLDGRPAAALYGFRYRDRFLFYQSGFDPEFAKRSPSLVVLGLTIREALEEGVTEYDLLHGEERYKFHWASESRELVRYECLPPGAAATVLHHARRLGRASKSLAREWLPEPVAATLAGLRGRAS